MKNRTRKLGAALLLAAVAGWSQSGAAQEKSNIAWGGSNPGGVMYYMVGTAGTVISEKLPQYNITQVTTGGSTENAKRLIKGELDMGIVYGAHVYMAQKPEGPFATGEFALCSPYGSAPYPSSPGTDRVALQLAGGTAHPAAAFLTWIHETIPWQNSP